MSTKIEWTEETWNPVTGCVPVSAGCAHCYAKIFANRLKNMGIEKYRNGFIPTFHPESLQGPYHWKKSRMIFVCSMSDLFQDAVTDEQIEQVFEVMANTPRHTYQVLTKRAQRMWEWYKMYTSKWSWPQNVWAGVSIENAAYRGRSYLLRQMDDVKVRFISFEPLIGSPPKPLVEYLNGINWVIVGAESGPHARPMDENWVRQIRDAAVSLNIPFFYKQKFVKGDAYRRSHKVSMPKLDGRVWDEMPLVI